MTAREVLVRAIAKSARAQERHLTFEGEGLDFVYAALRALAAFGARVNPEFFGVERQVQYTSGGWDRPTDAELVFRIERADGAEVVPVPRWDRKAEEGLPAVYRFGRRFYPAGNPNDPSEEPLTFFFAARPARPASVDAELDAAWLEGYDELLVLEVALMLATKDGRADDLAALKEPRDRWALLYASFLEHETIGERRRYQNLRLFNDNTVVPLRSLLTGGVEGL